MEKINQIYIINLEKDKERYEKSIKQLRDYKLNNYNFIKAINGNNLNNNEFKSYTSDIGYYITSPSMVGCGMSHIKTWEKIVQNNIQYSLILEDDFIFKENFLNDFNELIRNVPDNFDLLFLNENILVNKYLKIQDINNYLYKPLFLVEMVGYIITLEGAKKLLKKINKVSYHIDVHICINHLLNNNELNIIASKKPLIYQIFNTSNNQYDYNYPLIVDNFINKNYLINYIYKVIFLSIFNIKINLNFLLILILGYFYFPYAFLLLILEYFIIKKNNNLISNFIFLLIPRLIKVLV